MNREITQEIYKTLVDDDGNVVLDENGIAVTVFLGTEVIIEPDPVDNLDGEILNPVMHIDDQGIANE